MNPALVPILSKIGSVIIDRVAGSKKAAAASAVGTGVVGATVAIDPGAMLYPTNDEYALIANSVFYLIGLIALAYKERKEKYDPFIK